MSWSSAQHGEAHIEAHVDLCPDHKLHMKVGNIGLHLCRKDFLQLAQAIVKAVEQLSLVAGIDETDKNNLH